MTLLQFLNQFVNWDEDQFVVYRRRTVDGKDVYDDFPLMTFRELCENHDIASKLLNTKVVHIGADCGFDYDLGLHSYVVINAEED